MYLIANLDAKVESKETIKGRGHLDLKGVEVILYSYYLSAFIAPTSTPTAAL